MGDDDKLLPMSMMSFIRAVGQLTHAAKIKKSLASGFLLEIRRARMRRPTNIAGKAPNMKAGTKTWSCESLTIGKVKVILIICPRR